MIRPFLPFNTSLGLRRNTWFPRAIVWWTTGLRTGPRIGVFKKDLRSLIVEQTAFWCYYYYSPRLQTVTMVWRECLGPAYVLVTIQLWFTVYTDVIFLQWQLSGHCVCGNTHPATHTLGVLLLSTLSIQVDKSTTCYYYYIVILTFVTMGAY